MTIGNKNLLFTLEKISNDEELPWLLQMSIFGNEEDELKDLSKNLFFNDSSHFGPVAKLEVRSGLKIRFQ